MMIWTVFAVMTVAVLGILLAPLARRPSAVAQRADYNRMVFRDQLAELDRDVERGLIGAPEAQAARNEISRRLIQTVQTPAAPATSRRMVHVFAALLVPFVAIALYLESGSPGLPDVPRAARLEKAAEAGDFEALVAKVEQHLAANPDDAQGWGVLAPAYKRERRWTDAAEAYSNILRLSPPTAETLSDFAEMIVFAKEGLVTADARRAFDEARKLDPQSPKPRFYLALALKQEGKVDEATAAMQALLADSPPDAGWRPMVENQLKDMASRPPALAPEQQAAASTMTDAGQQQMIRSMVDGLEERLSADANDLEGWLRLIRARAVLNESDRAKTALATARSQFKDKPEALAALDGLARELNLL